MRGERDWGKERGRDTGRAEKQEGIDEVGFPGVFLQGLAPTPFLIMKFFAVSF